MPNKRSQLSRNYINVLFHHFFKKLDSHSLGSLRFPSPLNCSSAPPPHRPRPLGRHSSPLLLTCRIHGLMDELWRCKMAAQTMDGPTQRRTNEGGRERERERDRSNFTLFYTKAQLCAMRAPSLGFLWNQVATAWNSEGIFALLWRVSLMCFSIGHRGVSFIF